MEIAWIDPSKLPDVWPDLQPLARKLEATTKGEHTEASVIRKVAAGEYSLVAAIDEDDGVLGLTAVKFMTDGSGRKILLIVWTVGNHASRWSDKVIEKMTEYGEAQGFYKVTTVARRGWARKSLKDFTVSRWVYEKTLGDG